MSLEWNSHSKAGAKPQNSQQSTTCNPKLPALESYFAGRKHHINDQQFDACINVTKYWRADREALPFYQLFYFSTVFKHGFRLGRFFHFQCEPKAHRLTGKT